MPSHSCTACVVIVTAISLVVAILLLGATTHAFSNAWLMLTDRSNVMPAESSILWFEPYVINQGSSNYWLYGKDRTNYYHFVHLDEALYLYLPINNRCPGFDRENIRTWCDVRIGQRH
jgi:hypothetical protein